MFTNIPLLREKIELQNNEQTFVKSTIEIHFPNFSLLLHPDLELLNNS